MFLDCIWNHHGRCIQSSTNLPNIGSVSFGILEFCDSKRALYDELPRAMRKSWQRWNEMARSTLSNDSLEDIL